MRVRFYFVPLPLYSSVSSECGQVASALLRGGGESRATNHVLHALRGMWNLIYTLANPPIDALRVN